MAGEPHPRPPALLDTPRRRLSRASRRDLLFIVPVLAALIAAGVLVGRWGAFAVLAAVVLVRTAMVTRTGATPSMRRLGISYVRLGTGAVPERWRLVAHQLGPLIYVAALFVALETDPGAPVIVAVAYLLLLAAGWWRAKRAGHADVEPMMALAGLDVWWAGDPPTPSGTSEPPAPAPPPPIPGAPPTPAPAPRRGWPGPR